MDREEIERAMAEAATEILGEAAFVFAEVLDSPEPWSVPPLAAELRLMGPFSGRLVFATSPELAASLCVTLLGMDQDAAGELAADAVREILNIVAGHIVPNLYGAVNYKLGLPAVIEWNEEMRDSAFAAVGLKVDDVEPLELAFFLEEPA